MVKKETGQGTVEFAFVIIIFIPLLIFIIEIGWIGFQYISFDYGYQIASWEISISESESEIINYSPKYISGNQAVNSIKNGMTISALGLDKNNLSINDAQIKLWTDKKIIQQPGIYNGYYEKSTYYYRKMLITAKLKYSIIPLTNIGKSVFGDQIIISKNLKRERLNSGIEK